jgi:hypothetical protein
VSGHPWLRTERGMWTRFHHSRTGAIGDTFLLGESETSSFGVSGEARLLPYDRTKAGEDMSSKWDWGLS